MDDIYNNIVIDESIFMDKDIIYREMSKEQQEQLNNGQCVRLPDGGIMVSTLMRAKE